MKRAAPLLLLGLMLAGCTWFEDNGTHLAYALEKGAAKLRKSDKTELIVTYTTLDASTQPYYVEITPSGDAGGRWGSYLVVSGKTSGGTSYHNRFVYVPTRLHIEKKTGGTTEVVLRRDGDRISVIALR